MWFDPYINLLSCARFDAPLVNLSMPLLRHYLRISPGLQEYVLHIDPAVRDWEQDVFKDITEDGSLLVLEALSPNDQGERIGLCGDKYYCEAGRDREREDSLFVYKVEATARRQLRTVPRRYPAQLYLLELRFAPRLDPTNDLWLAPLEKEEFAVLGTFVEPIRPEPAPVPHQSKRVACFQRPPSCIGKQQPGCPSHKQ